MPSLRVAASSDSDPGSWNPKLRYLRHVRSQYDKPNPYGIFRVVRLIAVMQRNLRHASRPGDGQLAGGLIIAEEHVRHPLPFRAGRPCRDEAALLSASTGFRINGRPENNTVTTGMPGILQSA